MSIQGCTATSASTSNLSSPLTESPIEQVEAYPGWRGAISTSSAEQLLTNQPPYTYLLRQGEVKDGYCLSFVHQDGSIQHQNFALDLDLKWWAYKSARGDGAAKSMRRVITMMMLCGPRDLKPMQ